MNNQGNAEPSYYREQHRTISQNKQDLKKILENISNIIGNDINNGSMKQIDCLTGNQFVSDNNTIVNSF